MSVSVIIPTLNEAGCLAGTLSSLREQRPREIIVVDGGSQDTTCQIARAMAMALHGHACPPGAVGMAPIRLLHSPPGRARQMNLGAGHATGDILLFLHADCQLESGALEAAENCL